MGDIRFPNSVDQSKLAPRNPDILTTVHLTRSQPYVGKLTYSREIEIPDFFENRNIRLIIEHSKPTTLWVNGDSIGQSSLILSPQIYALNGKLKQGKNQIKIRIDNSKESVPSRIQGSHSWVDHTQTNWNEFTPSLYRLNVTLYSKQGNDNYSVNFGMRAFKTEEVQNCLRQISKSEKLLK